MIEAIKNLKSGSNTENTESKIDLIAPVVAEPVEEKSAFPLIADVTPVTSHASPKQAGPFEFHISPKAVREFKDSPKLNTSRRSTNTPKASPKLNSRRSVGTPKKTEIGKLEQDIGVTIMDHLIKTSRIHLWKLR